MSSPPSHFLLPLTLLLAGAAAQGVVINEIHYNPPDNTVRQEFVELYNPGDQEVDLTGWRLSGAVTYPFPEGTSIPADGYLVVAEDPPTIVSTLRVNALGPYDGNLDSEGETIRLRNQDDQVVDFADYRVGFPWPVAANGDGPSIELIHPGLDNSLGSSWRSARRNPTAGKPNSVLAENAAPNIRKVNHIPQQPAAADPVVITALVTDPDGVAEVSLEYQVVLPGRYIPSHLPHSMSNLLRNPIPDRMENRNYARGWTAVPMLDDGTGDDATAGDGIFTVTLPVHEHRTLVRYRITVEDEAGLSERVPYPDDASLNFAYFVYDGVPPYQGNSTATMESLPVYHLVTRNEDYAQCIAYNGGDQIQQGTNARFYYNWSGTLVYDGVVYDNIRYRLRGANGRYHLRGKRSMRLRLNDGYYFQARDQSGRKYPRKWRTLTTGKCFDNRQTLTYSVNEALTLYLYNKFGVPGSNTHWIHWRVIDGEEEAPDRWRGDFHGLYFVLETYDVRFMEAHGMEKGNLYKLINQTRDWQRQQRYQAAFGAQRGADHNYIENSLGAGTSASDVRAHVNLEKWYRWHAMVEAVRHYDFWPDANKNMVYYFEPDYTPANNHLGKLWILPWDTDASWGPTWNNGQDVVYPAVFSSANSSLWPDYFNTVRELRDLIWQRDQIEPLVDEFSRTLRRFERVDSIRWRNVPNDVATTEGSYSGLGGAGANSLGALIQDLKNFAFEGGNWPGGGVGAGGRAVHLDSLASGPLSRGEGGQIPRKPTLRYSGAEGFPTNGLSFVSSSFSDPQGADSFGAMEWRIAQITDSSAPNHDPTARFKLEIEADWESGELTTFDQSLVLPTTAVRSGLTYRARVRHKDNTRRWSHWSDPIEFTTTLPDISGYLDGLVISEFNYHPIDPNTEEFEAGFTDDDDFEWIEIQNVGPVDLDLTDVRLTKGVDFDFLGSDITTLAPGEFVLVVSNRAAFEMRYGTGLPVAGEWDREDRLDNGGERLKLSFGAGDPIVDFVYDDVAPWPTSPDLAGHTLVLANPQSRPDPSLATSWRASAAPHGTPGAAEVIDSQFGTWLAAHGATDPMASFDGSSLSNLMAYAVGADLAESPEAALPVISTVEVSGEFFPALTYRARQDAAEVTYLVEVSEDLVTWESGEAFTGVVGDPHDNGDGTVSITVRSLAPVTAKPSLYLRLQVSLR